MMVLLSIVPPPRQNRSLFDFGIHSTIASEQLLKVNSLKEINKKTSLPTSYEGIKDDN